MLGKNFSRQHFEILFLFFPNTFLIFLFFPENRLWHFMQIVFLAFWCCLLNFLPSMLSINVPRRSLSTSQKAIWRLMMLRINKLLGSISKFLQAQNKATGHTWYDFLKTQIKNIVRGDKPWFCLCTQCRSRSVGFRDQLASEPTWSWSALFVGKFVSTTWMR